MYITLRSATKNYLTITKLIAILLLGFLACNGEEGSQQQDKPETTSADSVAVADTVFFIQIAAYRDSSNAVSMVTRLLETQLPATIKTGAGLSGEKIYRVQVGPYYLESATFQTLNFVRQLGFEDAFVKTETISSDSTITTEASSDKQQLTFTGNCANPLWSPNNREIVFFRKDNKPGIYSIGTGGGNISKIIESDNNLQIQPRYSWSNSGEFLTFVATVSSRESRDTEQLYVVNKNGRGLRKLLAQTYSAFSIAKIAWSTDDTHIAIEAYSDDDVDYKRKVLILSSKRDQFLKNENYDLLEPDKFAESSTIIGWKSDSELLYLVSEREYLDGKYRNAIWQYDTEKKTSRMLRQIEQEQKLLHTKLLPDSEFMLISASKQHPGYETLHFSVLHISAGAENMLVEVDTDGSISPLFGMSQNNDIFIVIQNQLWQNNISGNIARITLDIEPEGLTVSPRGRKVCFLEKGDLFIWRFETLADGL